MRTLLSWRTALVVAAVLVLSAWDALAGCPPSARGAARFIPRSPSPTIEITSASQAPIWRSVTIGEYNGVNAMRAAIDASPCLIGLGSRADEILGRPAFPYNQMRKQLDLVVISVAELGFGAGGASLRDAYARAIAIGLELCPADVGPMLRMIYLEQPVGDSLHIAMRPISTYNGELVDFTLANGGAGLLLIGGDANPNLVLAETVRFVFVRPQIDAVSGAEHPPTKELVKR